MSDVAIRCEGLSKRYRIGEQERYKALRDVIADTAAAPFRRLRHAVSGNGHTSAASASAPGSLPSNTIWALDDVSFEVKRGEVVGIIGRNGAGKSTLLKILSRITKPTKGHAEIHGRIGSLLEVGTGFHPELTGRENIYLNGAILGMHKAEIDRKFDEIVAFAEVEKFIDTPVKRYSSGMHVRLAFAVAAHMETEILLVDEVLAVGDAQFQKKCLGKMGDVAKQGRTILFVSHNMGATGNLCRTGVVLDQGRVAARGNIQDVIGHYNRALAIQLNGHGRLPHVIYEAGERTQKHDCFVSRVEVLDLNGAPKSIVSTWDDLVFRIWYSSKTYVGHGSIVLELSQMGGPGLLLLSTQPDGTLPVSFEVGEGCLDCTVKKIPFAAGEYVIGAGLAVPNVEWLWREQELGRLTIVPKDVYGSGVAPAASRSITAVEHSWRRVS